MHLHLSLLSHASVTNQIYCISILIAINKINVLVENIISMHIETLKKL